MEVLELLGSYLEAIKKSYSNYWQKQITKSNCRGQKSVVIFEISQCCIVNRIILGLCQTQSLKGQQSNKCQRPNKFHIQQLRYKWCKYLRDCIVFISIENKDNVNNHIELNMILYFHCTCANKESVNRIWDFWKWWKSSSDVLFKHKWIYLYVKILWQYSIGLSAKCSWINCLTLLSILK